MSKADEYADALRTLDEMRDEGIIDQAGYERRRKALLAESGKHKPTGAEVWAERRRIVDEDLTAGRIGRTEHAAKMRELDDGERRDISVTRGLKFGCLGVVALIVLVCVMVALNPGDRGPSEASLRRAAITECRAAVKGVLKAPSTAKFSGESAAQTNGVWKVTGDVEAQNSFGAMTRARFACDVTGQEPTAMRAKLTGLE